MERTLKLSINTFTCDLQQFSASNAHEDRTNPVEKLFLLTREWDNLNAGAYDYVVRNARYKKDAGLIGQLKVAEAASSHLRDALSDATEPPLDKTIAHQLELDEPRTARCDAVIYTRAQVDITTIPSKLRQAEEAWKSFRALAVEPASFKPSASSSEMTPPPNVDASMSPEEIEKASFLYNRFPYRSAQSCQPDVKAIAEVSAALAPPAPPPPNRGAPLSGIGFLFPQLLVKYKRYSGTFLKAFNQVRMYLTSTVAFYAAVGILDWPVFGLATDGTVGHVLMAWRTKTVTTEEVPKGPETDEVRISLPF